MIAEIKITEKHDLVNHGKAWYFAMLWLDGECINGGFGTYKTELVDRLTAIAKKEFGEECEVSIVYC